MDVVRFLQEVKQIVTREHAVFQNGSWGPVEIVPVPEPQTQQPEVSPAPEQGEVNG